MELARRLGVSEKELLEALDALDVEAPAVALQTRRALEYAALMAESSDALVAAEAGELDGLRKVVAVAALADLTWAVAAAVGRLQLRSDGADAARSAVTRAGLTFNSAVDDVREAMRGDEEAAS